MLTRTPSHLYITPCSVPLTREAPGRDSTSQSRLPSILLQRTMISTDLNREGKEKEIQPRSLCVVVREVLATIWSWGGKWRSHKDFSLLINIINAPIIVCRGLRGFGFATRAIRVYFATPPSTPPTIWSWGWTF